MTGLPLTRIALCLALAACTGGTETNNDTPDAGDDPIPRAGLDACADVDVDLGEAWNVNNLHGVITAMTIAADGTVVLATEDGSVKQWSIGTTADTAPLAEGRPSYGTPFVDTGDKVTALAARSTDDVLVTGDSTGMFRHWSLSDVQQMGSNAFAETALADVAVSEDGQTVAIADVSFAGNVRVFALGAESAGDPLATALWDVYDLSFEPDGDLLMAGANYGMAAIERRSAADGSTVDAWDDLMTSGAIVSIDHDAEHVVAASREFVAVLDATDLQAGPVDTLELADDPAVSTALSASGDYVAVAYESGRVVVYERDGLAEVSSYNVPTPVAIGLDPSGDRLVVASTDGRLRALTCQ